MFTKAGVFFIFLFVTSLVSLALEGIGEDVRAVIILVFGLFMSGVIAAEYKPK